MGRNRAGIRRQAGEDTASGTLRDKARKAAFPPG